jgi:hypothetical protein
MDDSLSEVGALLQKWRNSGQSIIVLYSSEAESWHRSGKVLHVRFGEIEIDFNNDETRLILYSPALYKISEDGQSLNITYPSGGGSVVIFENHHIENGRTKTLIVSS